MKTRNVIEKRTYATLLSETLSDGSKVYSVKVAADIIECESEKAAMEIFTLINKYAVEVV